MNAIAQTPAGLSCYEGVNGENVYLNTSEKYVLLRDIKIDDMEVLLARFRSLQMTWLRQYLLTECEQKNDAGFQLIEGLRGQIQYHRSTKYFYFTFLTLGQIPESAWNVIETGGLEKQSHRSLLMCYADIDLQKRFMLEIIGDDTSEISKTLKIQYVDTYCFAELEAILSKATGAEHFIALVAARAEEERRPRSSEERRGPRQANRLHSVIPDAFLFWLTQEGFLMRPVRPRVFYADSRGFEFHLMTPLVKELWTKVHTAFVATRKRKLSSDPVDRTLKKRAIRWERDLLAAFLITVSASSIRNGYDISEEIFNDLFTILDKKVETRSIPDLLSTVFRALRDTSPTTASIPLIKSLRVKESSLSNLFTWTRMTFSVEKKSFFPDSFSFEYVPKDNVIAFAAAFEATFSKLEAKHIGNYRSSMNHFLCWLATTNRTASDVTELVRNDINDGVDAEKSNCFRAYLIGKGINGDTVTSNLARVATVFDILIADLPALVPNPIVMRFDAMKGRPSRGKTPRRALGREMLDFIRDFNARDDFAFSKSRQSHYRTLFDRVTGKYLEIWFPGVARILDLLLRLPIRGFQGRYLDSGEGDEFIPDFDGPKPSMVRNDSPLAQKGRRCGVLTVIEDLHEDLILGLYINTNKTRVGRQDGYEIPWCEESLRKSFVDMIEWQKRWNPLAVPVLCVDKYRQPENPDILALIQTSFPIFRDPAESGGWPVGRDIIYHYWDDLCAAVEDDLANGNGGKVRVRLTEDTVKNKGSGKTWRRREARYDIHTLRVSGISALIEAGMPPDLVRQVAGHSTVVMTLYYNVVMAAKLNDHLRAALLRTATDFDAIDALADEDFDRVAEFLVNTRSADDAIGLSMLRDRIGYGTGEFEVMSHGICPGGECSTGGEWTNQAVGHKPVLRSLACSLCRYRLTGPMFLPGLVLNANRLIHELRRKGQEIADLNVELQAEDRQSKAAHVLRGQIEGLYRETGIIAEEWSAEVQYVHVAKDLLAVYILNEANNGSLSERESGLPALITGLESLEVEAKLETRSDFALLQTLSEGAHAWFGFKPKAALSDHREFLNEILSANGLDPFLLRLSGKERDIAANLLGRAIVAVVPDDRIDDLHAGAVRLSDFPGVDEAMRALKEQALEQSANFRSQVLENQRQLES